VGEEVVRLPREIKAFPQGAGENGALKANGYFEPCPHPIASRRLVNREA
jgi:hypothetical protein